MFFHLPIPVNSDRDDVEPAESERPLRKPWTLTGEENAVELMENKHFVAFGLHDCYADKWLPGYERLLETMGRLARLRTLDDVASQLFLAAAG